MACAEQIVGGFVDPQEARQAAVLPNGGKLLTSACQNLMHIALVADIPDQFILGNIVDFVQGESQFNDAEGRGEMAAGLGDCLGQVNTNFLCQGAHLIRRQAFEVGRAIDPLEQGGLALHARHFFLSSLGGS